MFSQEQIQEAISSPIPDYINNLRDREFYIKQDCFRRGKLAEIWFRDFFVSYRLQVQTNIPNGNTDMDLVIYGIHLNNFMPFIEPICIEIKSSLIPFNNFNIFEDGDLKIYKKSQDFSVDTKNWNIGIQIYFNTTKQTWEDHITILKQNQYLQALTNLNFNIFWATQQQAISYHNASEQKTWTFRDSSQEFWKCPLKNFNQNPHEMIIYLLQILLQQQNDNILQLQTYINNLSL